MIFEVAVGSSCCCRVMLFVLCSGDYVVDRVSVLGDSEIDDAGVVYDFIAMVIVLWIQYENV